MSIGQLHHPISSQSEEVQQRLTEQFARVDAYQYNPSSIRLRIVDERFRGLPKLARVDLVEPFLDGLTADLQEQLIFVLCLASGEETDPDFGCLNREFEEPDPPAIAC